MAQDLALLSQKMISAAKKAGADSADALAVAGTSVSVNVRAGALEKAERSEGVDLGLRVLVGQKQACVSASDSRDETIEEMAARAVAMAKLGPDDPHIGLASEDMLSARRDADGLELYDPSAAPTPDSLKESALTCEEIALSYDGITQAEASAAFGERRVAISASNGFTGQYQRNDRVVSVVAITGEGANMERDYAGESRIYASDMPSAEEIGHLAAERTLARIGARKPQTGSFPVMFDERISSSLISHLLGAVNGSAIARGASFLRDKMGEQVLPLGMSLIEDPHKLRGPASRPFDAEGMTTAKRAIIEDGILKSWTLDLATARKLGLESTGNAARGVAGPPSPSTTNIALTPGDKTREELLRDMGTGLLVTSMIGASINPNTGDYSRGANGFWIENGEIAYPVNECTIAGNLNDILRGFVAANDGKEHLSYVVPSLLVEGMTIAGG